MSSEIIGIHLPNGWENGIRQKFAAGDLSKLLKDEFKSDLKFNLLTLEPEFKDQSLTSNFVDNFYVFLSEAGYMISKGAATDALLVSAHRNAFHPVVDYLEDIEKDDSIEPIDLEKVSTDYLGVDDPLSNSMLAMCLIGAVARALNRGVMFKHCCVLKGAQGIGKSSFWRILASPEWFCDTMQTKDQDLFLAIQTCWFYELQELDYMTSKHEQGKLKAWISSREDKFRLPYGRATDSHQRPSIFVGSCNRSDFLTDSTGNVRFWVIDIPDKIDLPKLKQDRNRIFKAAIKAYREDEKTYNKIGIALPDELQRKSDIRNLEFEAEHPFFSRLAEWTSRKVNQYPFTSEQALIGSGCRDETKLNPNDAKEAGNCLRKLGYIKDTHQQRDEEGKKQARRWRLPEWPNTKEALKIEMPRRFHHEI
ncbi:VapE domain-containing protein [Prochlorococcus marinus]|uniref:VapE domain-containing protein n=1 Tax=Prochlorococcus marinus TaxID=1219 RepID=UPI0022B2B252|nr:VapE domain-containing protein [Prochlorococcus marinus]